MKSAVLVLSTLLVTASVAVPRQPYPWVRSGLIAFQPGLVSGVEGQFWSYGPTGVQRPPVSGGTEFFVAHVMAAACDGSSWIEVGFGDFSWESAPTIYTYDPVTPGGYRYFPQALSFNGSGGAWRDVAMFRLTAVGDVWTAWVRQWAWNTPPTWTALMSQTVPGIDCQALVNFEWFSIEPGWDGSVGYGQGGPEITSAPLLIGQPAWATSDGTWHTRQFGLAAWSDPTADDPCHPSEIVSRASYSSDLAWPAWDVATHFAC